MISNSIRVQIFEYYTEILKNVDLLETNEAENVSYKRFSKFE
jgi:hypothetical protein